MKIYAVIDTNVLVSALFTHNAKAATFRVLEAMLYGVITPLYNKEILDEYENVLKRPKFHFSDELVEQYLEIMTEKGIRSHRVPTDEPLPDPKDVVFYEVAMSKEDAYLVTGNTKHFPQKPIVVTPAEMVAILEELDLL